MDSRLFYDLVFIDEAGDLQAPIRGFFDLAQKIMVWSVDKPFDAVDDVLLADAPPIPAVEHQHESYCCLLVLFDWFS